MRTTATNKKMRELLLGIRNKTLIPRPEFQRRLVWVNKHKVAFIQTVLMGYPFPEIYVASGHVDPDTGEGTQMLVDGQQRMTTLNQYFTGSPELKLGGLITPYAQLPEKDKRDFLEYDVVVRDLGQMSIESIKGIFRRINSTNYALNAMEIHNARFDGEFKKFGEEIADSDFFEEHRVFSASDIRRMNDLRYTLGFIITIMSTYFNRDDELEAFLERYNDEFEEKETVRQEIERVFAFIEKCDFDPKSRAWKKTDLFTLLVETHRVLIKENLELDPGIVGSRLRSFYSAVDSVGATEVVVPIVEAYYLPSLQATNDRSSRIKRGEIIRNVMLNGW